jgi:predicted amidohydrolase YtcJ
MADRKGMLRPGFLGDVVVLSGNPLQKTGQSLAELDVVHTVMGGQVTLRDGALTS